MNAEFWLFQIFFSPGAQIQLSQAGIDKIVHAFLDHLITKHHRIDIPETFERWGAKVYDIVLFVNIDHQTAAIKLLDSGDISVEVSF
jgi:hypothetical protein